MERISRVEHRTNEEILKMVDEKRSLIGIIRSRQRNWLHGPHNERRLHSKNYNRGKNGREKEKRKAENGVTGLDDERGLQQVEGESWTSC